MKTKLDQGTMIAGVVAMASASAGMGVSDGLVNLAGAKEKQIVKLGLTAAGLFGAAALTPEKSTTGKTLMFLSAGMAAKQGFGLLRDAFVKNRSPREDGAQLTAVDKFTDGFLGLACPDCDVSALAAGYNAEETFDFPLPENVNQSRSTISTLA